MSAIDRLLRNNEAYAQTTDPGRPRARPATGVAVVACMDARLDVFAVLRLRPGDAHVIRNAGGVVTDDVIRSLLISQRELGTRHVALIHHSECGMLKVRDEELKDAVERDTGVRPPFALEGFASLEEDLRRSAARIADSPFLTADGEVRGFVYDVHTGRLREVDLHAGAFRQTLQRDPDGSILEGEHSPVGPRRDRSVSWTGRGRRPRNV